MERTVPAPAGAAAVGWLAAWFGGAVIATATVLAVGADTSGTTALAVSAVAQWVPLVAVAVWLVRHHGHAGPWSALGLRVRPVDLVGVPLGLAAQLLLVPGLYEVLQRVWPGTFDTADVERRARELWERASGGGTASVVVLVVVVAIGAPIVEEIVYRGLLQRSLHARTGVVAAWLIVSAWFAAVHFQPVEFPGLLLAGLLFGGAVALTDRLGAAVAAHIAFNVAGLVVVGVG